VFYRGISRGRCAGGAAKIASGVVPDLDIAEHQNRQLAVANDAQEPLEFCETLGILSRGKRPSVDIRYE